AADLVSHPQSPLLVRLAGVGDERLAVPVAQHADADHREARRGSRFLGRRRLHLLAGLLPAGIEEIPVDDRPDQGGRPDAALLVRPPSLAAAITPPALGVAPLPVLRPLALGQRIGPVRPGLDGRQRAAPRAHDLEREEEGDDDEEPVQDGPAPHQRLSGGRGRLFISGAASGDTVVVGCEAPGVVVVAAAWVVVTAPPTVGLVAGAPGAAAVVVVAPGAAAGVVGAPGAAAVVAGARG